MNFTWAVIDPFDTNSDQERLAILLEIVEAIVMRPDDVGMVICGSGQSANPDSELVDFPLDLRKTYCAALFMRNRNGQVNNNNHKETTSATLVLEQTDLTIFMA